MTTDPGIYLTVPCYPGVVDFRIEGAIHAARTRFPLCAVRMESVSALCLAFNIAYAQALNMRGQGITHFVMLHSDVVPAQQVIADQDGANGRVSGCWIDVLLSEMAAHGLDAISAVVAIKHDKGETSTGVERAADGGDKGRLRLSNCLEWEGATRRAQDMKNYRLLINTGCMVIDIRKPWAERLYFRTQDAIRKDAKTGLFEAHFEPEDWEMSRMLSKWGVPYGATTALRVEHMGRKAYPNWRTEE